MGNFGTKNFAYAYYDESFQDVSLDFHHHTQNEIVFATEGRCIFNISGKETVIGKNQILLISALEHHSTQMLEFPYRRYVFVSSMDICSEYIHDPVLATAFTGVHRRSGAVSLDPALAEEMERHFKTLVAETGIHHKKWEDRCAAILTDILILLYRSHPELFVQEKNRKQLSIIFSIKNYLDQHYNEELDLDVIAQKFYISKYYLSHQFKNITGYGFKNYIQLLRINRAKIFLQSTDLSVNEICIRIGYDNINYFIRLFKEKENITPHQYRKLFIDRNGGPVGPEH